MNFEQPLPAAETGYQTLVVGLGPAGFSLAHYLERDGHKVVGIDGAKLEPLPAYLLEKTLIKDSNILFEKLDERILSGFGGVAEYGITVRWNKNYLKIFTNLTKDVLYPGELGTRFPRKRTEKISRMAKNHHRKFWGMGRIK